VMYCENKKETNIFNADSVPESRRLKVRGIWPCHKLGERE